jgi:hydrogenase maturation protease
MILVIGYGNPLRGDDGAGWYAAQRLADDAPAAAEVVVCHQLTPELAEPISQAAAVIFIDAGYPADPAGVAPCPAVACQPITPCSTASAAVSHHLEPAGLLAYARLLYGRCPPAVLYTIPTVSFGYGEELSPAVLAMMPALIEAVHTRIAQHAAVAGVGPAAPHSTTAEEQA